MKKLLIVLVIAAVAVGAYYLMKSQKSGEEGTPTGSPSPSVSGMPATSGTPVTTPAAGANPMPKTHQVVITSGTFSTASLTVKKGDKVLFTNRSSQPQNVIADNGAFNSGDIPASGGSWTLDTTNLAAGTYAYHSSKQLNMEATLIVQ